MRCRVRVLGAVRQQRRHQGDDQHDQPHRRPFKRSFCHPNRSSDQPRVAVRSALSVARSGVVTIGQGFLGASRISESIVSPTFLKMHATHTTFRRT